MKNVRFLLLLAILAAPLISRGQSVPDEGAQDSPKINVYPNPVTNYLHVQLGTLKAEDVDLTVRNIIGNVMKPEREDVEQSEARLKVDNFPPGYYLVTISDDNARFKKVYKFLKR